MRSWRRLEAEVARLELHMEAMRAADQANAERLWYNRRVLVERASDNAATLTQQTRRLTRQRDALAELKVHYGHFRAYGGVWAWQLAQLS